MEEQIIGQVNDIAEKTDDSDKKDKGFRWDLVVAAIVLISLVVLYFFWGCRLDLPATVLAVVVVTFATILLRLQNKKINAMYEEKTPDGK